MSSTVQSAGKGTQQSFTSTRSCEPMYFRTVAAVQGKDTIGNRLQATGNIRSNNNTDINTNNNDTNMNDNSERWLVPIVIRVQYFEALFSLLGFCIVFRGFVLIVRDSWGFV